MSSPISDEISRLVRSLFEERSLLDRVRRQDHRFATLKVRRRRRRAGRHHEVVGITADNLGANYGIRLQGIGGAPLPEIPSASGEDFIYGPLRYDVSVLDPAAYQITDMHLGMSATSGVLGVVTLTVRDENSTPVGGTLCAEATLTECQFFGTSDTQFAALSRIQVETALGLDTEGGPGELHRPDRHAAAGPRTCLAPASRHRTARRGRQALAGDARLIEPAVTFTQQGGPSTSTIAPNLNRIAR